MNNEQHNSGTYRFLPAIAPYSGGVAANPGYRIVWANFRKPLSLAAGIKRAATVAAERGGAPDRLCAISLRSPAPMSLDEFAAFNDEYRALLMAQDVLSEGPNPIARTNVVPTLATPSGVVIHGFGFVEVADDSPPSFVIAGAAELRGQALDAEAIVRPGDTSPEAMREKAAAVMDAMSSRIQGLEVAFSGVTAVNVYTRRDFVPLVEDLLGPSGDGAVHGLRWYPSSPPVAGLDFEMDVRSTPAEIFID